MAPSGTRLPAVTGRKPDEPQHIPDPPWLRTDATFPSNPPPSRALLSSPFDCRTNNSTVSGNFGSTYNISSVSLNTNNDTRTEAEKLAAEPWRAIPYQAVYPDSYRSRNNPNYIIGLGGVARHIDDVIAEEIAEMSGRPWARPGATHAHAPTGYHAHGVPRGHGTAIQESRAPNAPDPEGVVPYVPPEAPQKGKTNINARKTTKETNAKATQQTDVLPPTTSHDNITRNTPDKATQPTSGSQTTIDTTRLPQETVVNTPKPAVIKKKLVYDHPYYDNLPPPAADGSVIYVKPRPRPTPKLPNAQASGTASVIRVTDPIAQPKLTIRIPPRPMKDHRLDEDNRSAKSTASKSSVSTVKAHGKKTRGTNVSATTQTPKESDHASGSATFNTDGDDAGWLDLHQSMNLVAIWCRYDNCKDRTACNGLEAWEEHLKKMHKVRGGVCKYPGCADAAISGTLLEHIIISHSGVTLKCRQCNMHFDTPLDVMSHLQDDPTHIQNRSDVIYYDEVVMPE